MTQKRQYWTKMDHAEARNAIGMMSDEEAGRWLRGWLSGAAGEEVSPSAPMEWRLGFSAGANSLKDAEEFSRKQAERVSARYTKLTAVDPVGESLPDATKATAVDPEAKNLPDLPITQHNTTQQTNKRGEQEQRAWPRQAAFTPPSEQEWVEYCTRTWSDWHPVCAGEAWAYYQGVGWIVGRKVCKDWKATARTAHGNARQWGKLQPQRQAWTPPAPAPITCKPGDLDGISMEAIERL